VVGAVACGLMAVKVVGINPGPAWLLVLALSVWLVYTSDRLMDGIKVGILSHSLRHQFHYRQRKPIILAILIISCIVGLITFLFLDKRIIYFGLILGFVILIYLSLVFRIGQKKHQLFLKEPLIALVYTAGIWGGPVVLSQFYLISQQWILILVTFLHGMLNLLILSLLDFQADTADGHTSFARALGIKTTRLTIYSISISILILNLFILFTSKNSILISAASIFILMDILQILVLLKSNHLRKNVLYRTLGEMVFWLPGIIIFF